MRRLTQRGVLDTVAVPASSEARTPFACCLPSTSTIHAQIDFGAGGPHHAKTDILPWADWWYSATAGRWMGMGCACKRAGRGARASPALQPNSHVTCICPAVGIDDGKGIIVRLVLPHGAAQQLRGHPMWSELAAEAQLVLAGERTQPFGMLA